MTRLHLEKPGLRGLGISESFKQDHKKSVLCGVVMRKDFVIDGFVFGNATIGGGNSTDQIIEMYRKLDRCDINYLLISGLILSMYNIVNVKKLFDFLHVPIIGVTYNQSEGIEDSIRSHFPNSYNKKVKAYRKLGERKKIKLKTNCEVYVRMEGCTVSDAKSLLNSLTLQGSVPEPLRVSHLLANTLLED